MKRVAVIKEKKVDEKRVILLPRHVEQLKKMGIEVLIESGAGEMAGYLDQEYLDYGGNIVSTEYAWHNADLILKYKPPIAEEFKYLNERTVLAALCHAEGDPVLINEFINKKVTVYTYEFFETEDGFFPLALPGGEIAGKVALIYGMYYLQSHLGGSGVLPISVKGAKQATIGIIGYGNVGASVIKTALELGNQVIVFGNNLAKMKKLSICFNDNNLRFVECTRDNLLNELRNVDILIGAILISTYTTEPIITEEMIKCMKKGSVIIDVTCGYGKGYMPVFERKTSLNDPVYQKEGLTYCKIDNLPCAFHKTTTEAYSSNVLPWIKSLCECLFNELTDTTIENGKIFDRGKIVHPVIDEHYKYYEKSNIQ